MHNGIKTENYYIWDGFICIHWRTCWKTSPGSYPESVSASY